MNIKISPQHNPLVGLANAQRSPSATTSQGMADGAVVALSHTAQKLNRLQSGDNDINPARVAAIRAALAAGTLQIDASRIADGLIDSARELLQEDPHACDLD